MAAKHGRFAQPMHAHEPDHHSQNEHQAGQPSVGLGRWPHRALLHVDSPGRCGISSRIRTLTAAELSSTRAVPEHTQVRLEAPAAGPASCPATKPSTAASRHSRVAMFSRVPTSTAVRASS